MHDTKENSNCINDEEQRNHALIAECAAAIGDKLRSACDRAGVSEVARIGILAALAYKKYSSVFQLDNVFNEQEARHLQILAVALYLEGWLDQGETARQTIYSFAAEKYHPEKRNTHHSPPDDRRKVLERAAFYIATTQELRKNQLQNEKEQWKQEQNQSDQPEKKPCEDGKDSNLQLPGRGHKYSFVELRTFDVYAEGSLDVFRLLVQRKELMTSTADKGSYEKLAAAYKRYDKLFVNARKSETDREYVIACMQIRKMEAVYRFHLAAKLAEYATANNLKIRDLINDSAKAIWGRYLSDAWLRPQDPFPINDPYDVLHYDRVIECVLQTESVAERAYCWRSALIDVFDFMNLLKPIKEQASWTDADFSEAAKFFRNDYPVVEHYVPVTVQENDRKAYFKNIQDIYMMLDELKDGNLDVLRKEMKKATAKRYSKKPKNPPKA